jgi:hypothetical protein
MATYTPKRLGGPAQAASSATSAYTVGSGLTAVVKQIVFTNTSASPVPVNAYLVPVSGSATTSTAFIYQLSIAPGSEIIWSADLPLTAGEQIYISAGTGSAVTYIISGIEIS